jgi:hypothetical protein
VLKFLSVNNIVIPPARTGKEISNKNEVINIAQTNKGILIRVNPRALMLKIVLMKLIAPDIDAIPAKCKLRIAKSTAGVECANIPESGGYTVHPVPAPPSTRLDVNNSTNAGGNNQKLKLFNLGKAMSTAPIIIGTNQFPNPPIKMGITIKKIITKA